MRSAYISVSQYNAAHKKLFIDNFVLWSKTAPPFVPETTSKVNLSMNYNRAPTQGLLSSVTTTRVQSWFTGAAVAQLVGKVVKWSKRWRFKSQLWLSTQGKILNPNGPCTAAAADWCMKGWMRDNCEVLWCTMTVLESAVHLLLIETQVLYEVNEHRKAPLWSPSVATLVVWVC